MKYRILFLMTSCKKSGPTQQTLNIIKNLDRNVFDPYLITIYDEEKESRLDDYLPYVCSHFFVKTSKLDIVLSRDKALRQKIQELNPDIIHSVGVFPDYAVSQMGKYLHINTIRNYVYDDFPAKFGWLRGNILARLQLRAIKKSNKTIACSESLSKIYKERLQINFDFIRNGVDIDKYSKPSETEKKEMRAKLGLPSDAFIFVFTGQFIERKNIAFLLENYVKQFGNDKTAYFLLLGGGPDLNPLKEKFLNYDRIDFRGSVDCVNDFLKACNVYLSASKSEGLPNGVLEAMATGLPVVLSDITQHREIYEADHNIGYLFKLNDSKDYIDKMNLIYGGQASQSGVAAYHVAHTFFSAQKMSMQYQKKYLELIEK